MKIKKFNNFSLKENKEIIDDKIEDIKNDYEDSEITQDEELEEPEEMENDDTELSDYTDFNSYGLDVINTKNTLNSGNIVIINGCDADSEVYKKTEEFKSKCSVECKEVQLYQLNIQSPKKQEPKDGMQQVYDAIENSDAIILACQINKGSLSDSLNTALARIKNYYKNGELKNKIFGAIILGSDEKIKNSLILTALNDLHMLVCADCLCFCDKSSDMKKMIDSVTTLSKTVSSINNISEEDMEDELNPFDEFTEEPNIDSTPMDKGLGDEDSNDEFVDSLKNDIDLSINDNDEELEEDELEDDLEEDESEDELEDDLEEDESEDELKEEEIKESFNLKSFDDFFKK